MTERNARGELGAIDEENKTPRLLELFFDAAHFNRIAQAWIPDAWCCRVEFWDGSEWVITPKCPCGDTAAEALEVCRQQFPGLIVSERLAAVASLYEGGRS